LVDTLARLIAASEIPLGILTSFVGAPFFLYLMLRRRRTT
jgi:iron complex transport system permease protein